ncbi:hypothetical protein GIB67_035591 [Kingdonia uniflora]|uniref:Pentatricopeptide repeat-containing protein n=1 Tax=Kingdonia uniflora TaxID=39325 RepID=A0A7J7LDH3_9MAGN|nr:hypothetical protein GIB67_035591 [Kingdonia uniflora]
MCKSNNLDEAKKLFDSLPSKEFKPNTRTFNIMIQGFMKDGLLQESENLLTEMLDKGPTPDNVTYSIMIRGFFQNNEIDKAVQFLNDMVDRDFPLNATNTSSVKDLLAADGLEGKFIGLVDKILPMRQSKGTVTTVELDV